MRKMKLSVVIAKFLVLTMLIAVISSACAHASNSVEAAGDILVYLLPATSTGLTIYHEDGKGTLQFAKSMALALGATFALKYIVLEERPNNEDSYSFPSAHSSSSFCSAEFLRKRYGRDSGIPAYAIATYVAFTRVHAKQHYIHDVVAGAAIGIASSYLFSRPYRGWQVQVEFDSKYHGLRVSRSW
jgi:membrane-associated phospholipid phosphatase